jgi:hypothetical protein
VEVHELGDGGGGAERGGGDEREHGPGGENRQCGERRGEERQRGEQRCRRRRRTDLESEAPDAARGRHAIFGPAGERRAACGQHRLFHVEPGGDGEADGTQCGLDLGPSLPGAREARHGDDRGGARGPPRHDAEPDAGIRPEEVHEAEVRRMSAQIGPVGAVLERERRREPFLRRPSAGEEDVAQPPAVLRLERQRDEKAVGCHGAEPQQDVAEPRQPSRHGQVASVRFEAKDRGRHCASVGCSGQLTDVRLSGG